MEKVILVRVGEIHLKGLNRPYFEKMLGNNIKKSLNYFKAISVTKTHGRFYIEGIDEKDYQKVFESLRKVFGLVSFSPAVKTGKDMKDVEVAAIDAMEEALSDKNGTVTFKVEARRSDKRYPMGSLEIAAHLGGVLLDNFENLKVDVHHPELRINIEIRENAYIYWRSVKGSGGMPVGTNGKATLLLSGGIDSPVAGWMIAKRGVEINAVHFYSHPYTSERAKQKVIDLAKLIRPYCGPIRLYVVSFTKIQVELYEKGPDNLLTILMRRAMMRIAEELGRKSGSKALITGEAIGQVASQTIDALVATNDVVDMPVFQPLIGFDKQEIVELAQKIGTFETSILPYEDCCTVFLPKHPATRPKLEFVRNEESKLELDELLKEAVENVEIIDI